MRLKCLPGTLGGGYRLLGFCVAMLSVLLLSSCSTKKPSPVPVPAAPAKKGKSALIIVDMQNDFCPGGAVAVKDADSIIPMINQLQEKFDLVVATQDWHPANHSSFSSNSPDGVWPDHCVQDTPGAELVAGLNTDRIVRVFQKGKNPEIDGYSGFYDNDHFTSTGMGDYLRTEGVTDVYIVGVATDYCVKHTALNAVNAEKFNTTLVRDATRGREKEEGDVQEAIDVLIRAGVEVTESSEILNN